MRSGLKKCAPMRLSLIRSCLAALLPVVLLLTPQAGSAQQIARVELPDSVRPVAPAGAASEAVPAALVRPVLTDTEAATPLHLEVVLNMHKLAELRRRVAAGEVISRSEMAARFLPTDADYQAVAQWLHSQGLTVAPEGASHAVVVASGTPKQLQQAFQASFGRVNFRGAEYTAAVSAPSLPAEIQAHVAAVHGLQPYLHPHKFASVQKAAAVSSDFSPPYLVGDILTAYNASASGLTGAGQQIGIVIDTAPRDSDLTAFWNANDVPQSLSNIITVNVTGDSLPAPSGEETLDVSWSSGIASGAQIVIYACGQSDLSNINVCYSRILDDLQDGARPNLHEISMSYGAGEETDETPDDINSTNQMFVTMAAYGVSLFAASGDNGAYADGDSTVQVLYPASDPSVTGVGGTTLILEQMTGAIFTETGWSPSTDSGGHGNDNGNGNSSSGGGISQFFDRPSWQAGSTVPSGTMRLVPDVAFAADPNDGCYLVVDGQVDQYGGTSWGSPSWAALCALINQARSGQGQAALGVANPWFYPLLGTTSFHDITAGNNGLYYAGVGFDLVTGLGTPDFDVLLQAVTKKAAIAETIPTITSALTASGVVDSAFTYQITASNSPSAFTATGLPTGLSLNTSTGLISGSPSATGTYTVTLGATNSGGTGTAALTLTVTAPAVKPVVTLFANVAQVSYKTGRTGQFTLTISKALATDLVFYYTIEGGAINGTDYAYLTGHAKILAGHTSKIVKIIPQGDLDGAAKRVVKIKLAPGKGYIVGTTGFVKITIVK
jgi:kumamolisin